MRQLLHLAHTRGHAHAPCILETLTIILTQARTMNYETFPLYNYIPKNAGSDDKCSISFMHVHSDQQVISLIAMHACMHASMPKLGFSQIETKCYDLQVSLVYSLCGDQFWGTMYHGLPISPTRQRDDVIL